MTRATIAEMVETLRSSSEVLGLVEYGRARQRDAEICGDYDLVVVLKEERPEVESLHFYVGPTPVDVNLRSIEEIERMDRAEGFDSVLLEGRVIHDPSGQVASALEDLRVRQGSAADVPPIAPARIAAMRHGARHTFDKIEQRGESDSTLSRYLLHQCVYWLVPQYFELRGIRYRGEKHALNYLRQNEPEIARDLDECYATADYAKQKGTARSIAEAVLAPVGGLWREDEVLVFGDPQKGRELFEQLFAEEAG